MTPNPQNIGAAPARVTVERRIYKETPEYAEYLRARFGESGLKSAHTPFLWQGHRWAYKHSSFDDAGEFCVIFRWEDAPSPDAVGVPEPQAKGPSLPDVTQPGEGVDLEVLVTAIEKSQEQLCRYIVPGSGLTPNRLIDNLLAILDDGKLVKAVRSARATLRRESK